MERILIRSSRRTLSEKFQRDISFYGSVNIACDYLVILVKSLRPMSRERIPFMDDK